MSSQVSAAVPKRALRRDALPHKPFRLEAAHLTPVIMVSVLRSEYNAHKITHAITYVSVGNQPIARERRCAGWPRTTHQWSRASCTTTQPQFANIGLFFVVFEYNIHAVCCIRQLIASVKVRQSCHIVSAMPICWLALHCMHYLRQTCFVVANINNHNVNKCIHSSERQGNNRRFVFFFFIN